MHVRWFILALLLLLLGFFSFCAAHRIYVLENKEPEYVYRNVPVEVVKPCPPPPAYTPPAPPPFNVAVVGKKWDADGRYQAAYQIEIPADGQWHDSRIQVSPGVSMVWNYDEGYSGGLSIRVAGSMEITKYLPLDYEKSFFRHRFIRRKEGEGYEKDEVVLESNRNVEFKAFENPLSIRLELWEQ